MSWRWWLLCLFCVGVVGFATGWMIGYGVPPDSQATTGVLAAVVTVLVSFLGIFKLAPLVGSRKPNDLGPTDPTLLIGPFGCAAGLFVGLALGLPRGKACNPPSATVDSWKDLGLSRSEIARRLFDQRYPPKDGTAPWGAVLSAAEASRVRAAIGLYASPGGDEALARVLEDVGDDRVKAFVEACRQAKKSPDASTASGKAMRAAATLIVAP